MDTYESNNSLKVLPDGIIELTQRGYQTAQSVGQFQSQIDSMTDDAHKQGQKVLILVDMTEVTGHDPQAREEGKKRMNGNYDAMAICGSDMAIRLIINWLIRLSGAGDKVRLFETRDSALAWLHERASS